MQTLTNVLGDVSGFIWGPVMLVLLMGTGLYLSVGLRGMTLMRIPYPTPSDGASKQHAR